MISIVTLFVVCSLGEYVVHRWAMHRRGSSFFQSHAVEHHGHNRNENRHMGLSLGQWVVANLSLSPLTITVSLLADPFFWIYQLAFTLWWFMSWGFIHRAIHDEPSFWWGAYLVPWFRWSRAHHLNHHKKVTTNFGAVFPWTDYLFGTHYKG